ncbi:hypothetical protein GXW82_10690 [Streptacidiphilus sp. 4-A2]|nr:hypothetical protein [Streptacidiphilus sp. 4-A2]
MVWNDQGKIASDTTVSGSTTYLYDTDGNLILRTDPGSATLFIGDTQIVETLTGSALTATRYYAAAGTVLAERSSTGDVQYLIPNRQGTDTLAVDAASQAVTRRQYTPFGQARGTTRQPGRATGGTSGALPTPPPTWRTRRPRVRRGRRALHLPRPRPGGGPEPDGRLRLRRKRPGHRQRPVRPDVLPGRRRRRQHPGAGG